MTGTEMTMVMPTMITTHDTPHPEHARGATPLADA